MCKSSTACLLVAEIFLLRKQVVYAGSAPQRRHLQRVDQRLRRCRRSETTMLMPQDLRMMRSEMEAARGHPCAGAEDGSGV
ncbi:uncharacterized protein BKA78DRAFT_302900 [Phyllosticta capitalensis]|uniref:Secreted protein n=1 Tax=Phyllosticta capitalensis TaxID=121624 RepID=A0ABR1Z3Z0_9PEZI